MKVFIIGIMLGYVMCFYTLPAVEEKFGPLTRPTIDIGELAKGTGRNPQTTLNAEPPMAYDKRRAAEESFLSDVLSRVISAPPRAPVSKTVLNKITYLLDENPSLATFIHPRLEDGLTNNEAVEILTHHYAFKQ